MRTWIIGSSEDCDVVVAQEKVSRRHCRFTETADGHVIEDLGSTNGTYVNGERIAASTRVTADDAVTLGALVPLPWPPASGVPGASVLTIGRAPDNDIVLDDVRVSSHHARLIVSNASAWIEDVGSANGTFVNAPDLRVAEATGLAVADTVYFGSFAVPASQLLPARAVPEATTPAPPPLPGPSPASASTIPWTMLLLAQSPALAILILLAFGRSADAPERLASTLFALAIASVWMGSSLAVWASVLGRSTNVPANPLDRVMLASPVHRIAFSGLLVAVQCAVLLAIVHAGSGLRGVWAGQFGVLVLAAAVGMSLGWLVFAMLPRPGVAVGVLVAAFAVMTAMGGRIVRVSDSTLGSGIAAAMPSRWAFEGLLLLENDHRKAGDARDLAEPYFPSVTVRMGPTADALALGFMLLGLSAAAAYLSANGKRSPAMGEAS